MRGTVDVTELLVRWKGGAPAALNELIPVVYGELHRLAHRHMSREQPGHGLQTTALVHEVYLRLVDIRRMGFANRAHFFAACSQVMRRILVDIARSHSRLRRGSNARCLPLDAAASVSACEDSSLLALDGALTELAKTDARKARVVEMRFYGGLTAEETAVALDVSPETVQRDWKFAKTWLSREIDRKGAHDGRAERLA